MSPRRIRRAASIPTPITAYTTPHRITNPIATCVAGRPDATSIGHAGHPVKYAAFSSGDSGHHRKPYRAHSANALATAPTNADWNAVRIMLGQWQMAIGNWQLADGK
jgi:hypothetical protein